MIEMKHELKHKLKWTMFLLRISAETWKNLLGNNVPITANIDGSSNRNK